MTLDSWTPPVPLAGDDMLAVWDLLDRPAWHAKAACRGMDPDMFFPHRGESPKPAQRICAMCPVRKQCEELAEARHDPHGIWGGLSGRARRRNRRAAA